MTIQELSTNLISPSNFLHDLYRESPPESKITISQVFINGWEDVEETEASVANVAKFIALKKVSVFNFEFQDEFGRTHAPDVKSVEMIHKTAVKKEIRNYLL